MAALHSSRVEIGSYYNDEGGGAGGGGDSSVGGKMIWSKKICTEMRILKKHLRWSPVIHSLTYLLLHHINLGFGSVARH